jgi:hypothetical protein
VPKMGVVSFGRRCSVNASAYSLPLREYANIEDYNLRR